VTPRRPEGIIELQGIAGSVEAKTSGGYVQAALTSGSHGKALFLLPEAGLK